ncbi:MAG: 4-(cytidine 5'-diphospho)-2-C-methyl-D-erythritol kinase [Sphingomicrobium sp.]
MRLRDTAYAKLNLALHVRGKLTDGRHALETIFAFCEDGDEVSVAPADDFGLTVDGPFAAGLASGVDNLVLRAATALQRIAGVSDGAQIQLTKNLPVASGIGGGSADAAATMRLLTKLWAVDPELSTSVAPELGSDVPACLLSLPCKGTGGGEALEPLNLTGVSGAPVLLVNPLVTLPTGTVFAKWNGSDGGPVDNWRDARNDLETAATEIVPAVRGILDWLRDQEGSSFARMSGSGATCFAIFPDLALRDRAAQAVPSHWWRLATRLR